MSISKLQYKCSFYVYSLIYFSVQVLGGFPPLFYETCNGFSVEDIMDRKTEGRCKRRLSQKRLRGRTDQELEQKQDESKSQSRTKSWIETESKSESEER